MTKTFKAYLAGFLDADGSIYVRLKPNPTYKYGFQIAPSVVFFQKKTSKKLFENLKEKTKLGYLRYRKDGIIEYTIGDRQSIKKILELTLPYLQLKKKQAKLMLIILEKSQSIQSPQEFLEVTTLIDKFAKLNYSKKHVINTQMVRNHMRMNRWPRRDLSNQRLDRWSNP